MNKVSLAVVLVVLLVCSFVSQVSVVAPEMSEPENVEYSERREDGRECFGCPNVDSRRISLEEKIDERIAPRPHVTLVGYEDNEKLLREIGMTLLDEPCVFSSMSSELTVRSSVTATSQMIQPLGSAGSGWINDRLVYDNPSYDERRPSIATDGNGYLYVAFERYYADKGRWSIRVHRSTDGGDTWSFFGGWYYSSYDIHYPSIAIDPYDNNVYVAYELEYSSMDHRIYCKVYDPSTGWLSAVGVDTDSDDDRSPSITSEYQYGGANYQYISYEYWYSGDDIDLMFAKSTDHGVSWSTKKIYGDWPDANVYSETSITNAEGYVYIAYRWGADYGSTCDIRVTRSADYGSSWTQYTDIDGLSNDCRQPSITATHGGHLVIVASEYYFSSSDRDICYSYSSDNGGSWSKGYWLASSTASEVYPRLTVDGQGSTSNSVYGYVHAVYFVWPDVKYRRAYYSSPTSWSARQTVNDARSLSSWSSIWGITTSFGFPCVTWSENRGSSENVYFSTEGATYTIATSPSGLQVQVDGSSYTAPKSFNWVAGYSHTIYAPSPQSGYVWESWSDGGAQSHSIIIGTSDTTIIAFFVEECNPQLSVSPTLLDFGTMNPGLTASKSFQVKNIGTCTLNWQASESCSWVTSVSPSSGSLGENQYKWVTVQISTSGLSRGQTYTCYISVTSNGGSETVTVKVKICEPILYVSPTLLDFGTMDPGQIDQKSFTVKNTGTCTLNWQASESCSWITSVSPSSGSLGAGAVEGVTVTISTSGLSRGQTYTCYVDLTSNGGSATVTVKVQTSEIVHIKSISLNREPSTTTEIGFGISRYPATGEAKICSLGVWAEVTIDNPTAEAFSGLLMVFITDTSGDEHEMLWASPWGKPHVEVDAFTEEISPVPIYGWTFMSLPGVVQVRFVLVEGETILGEVMDEKSISLDVNSIYDPIEGPNWPLGNVISVGELVEADYNYYKMVSDLLTLLGLLPISGLELVSDIWDNVISPIGTGTYISDLYTMADALARTNSLYLSADLVETGAEGGWHVYEISASYHVQYSTVEWMGEEFVFGMWYDRVVEIIKLNPELVLIDPGDAVHVENTEEGTYLFFVDNYADKLLGAGGNGEHSFRVGTVVTGLEYEIEAYSYFYVGPYADHPKTCGFKLDYNKWTTNPEDVYWILFSSNYKKASIPEYGGFVVSANSPVNIMVTAPDGLRIGYDPETGIVINEIPSATYSGPGSEPQIISIPNPLTGNYTIDAFGTGTGAFTITIQSIASNGSIIDSDTWQGMAVPDEQYSENVRLDSEGHLILPHDIEVTNLLPSKTVVGQGYSVYINVTVENQGDYTETFNVTVYYNETAITLPNGKNHTTTTLTSGNSTTITLTWNTTGVAKGNYTIKAIADTVPGETDTDDNTKVDGWVIVSMVGDLTGPDGWPDGKCDMRDIRKVAKLFGVNYPDPRYEPNCDINDDLKIDMRDIRGVAKHFGETDP